MSESVKWGIYAPGRIAVAFADGLRGIESGELYAVGSRSKERAEAFLSEHGGSRAYGSYEELVHDEAVDAIYIANPHNYHRDSALLCMEHGKPVLCEKPIAVNANEAEEMVSASERNNVMLMEGMWTRFLPAMQQARLWIDEGRIGEVRRVDAHIGFRAAWEPDGRLLNPDLAGGALLDVGIYVVSFAYWMTRLTPVEVAGQAHIGRTSVDEQSTILLKYETGALATLSCAVRTTVQNHAAVYGTDGWISFGVPFFTSNEATLHTDDGDVTFKKPFLSNGFEYEAAEFARCLRRGDQESPILPRSESVQIMKTLDELRADWGLTYPFEEG